MANRMNWLRKRSTKYGSHMAIMILIVLGILVAVYAFAMNHQWRFDLTKNRRYSLAPQSLKILENLKEPVKAYAFYKEGEPTREAAKRLLDLYQYHAKQFKWEFVDPDRFPLQTQRFNVNTYDTIVLELGERFEKVAVPEEERLTNALVKLTRERKRVIYFVQGHGEHGLENFQKDGYADVKKALEQENYEVEPLILAGQESVPKDADVVLIGGPIKAFQEAELESLRAYLDQGGKLLVLVDPEGSPNLDDFLHAFGIELGKDFIVDRGSRILVGDYLVPIIARYAYHPITQDFLQRPLLSYLPLARSVRPLEEPPKGVSVDILAWTGEGSWGERDVERLKQGEAQLNADEDLKGPVPVAAVATIPVEGSTKQGNIVVFGDSDFIANGNIDPNRSGNQDLFLNSVSWLTGQEDLISIRPKSAASRPVRLTPSNQILIFSLVVVAFPLGILLLGLGILWRKRWKK